MYSIEYPYHVLNFPVAAPSRSRSGFGGGGGGGGGLLTHRSSSSTFMRADADDGRRVSTRDIAVRGGDGNRRVDQPLTRPSPASAFARGGGVVQV